MFVTVSDHSTSSLKIVKSVRSQNAEKVTHIKGRLLGQAVILFNCAPFQNGKRSFIIKTRIIVLKYV